MQESHREAQTDHRPHQPAQVVARSAQHRMERIAQLAFQPASIHPMVRLQMSNGGFDRLSPFEPAPLLLCQRLVLAAMNDLHRRIILIHAAIPQVDNQLFG